MTEKKHGGARQGVGRKKAFDAKLIFRLSKDQQATVKAMGGARWLRSVIDAAKQQNYPLP